LVSQIERFLLEFGDAFAFVGRQWRLDVDGDECSLRADVPVRS
jgi:predicted nuclease of restriction endonuclease-like (RecB) superfamily